MSPLSDPDGGRTRPRPRRRRAAAATLVVALVGAIGGYLVGSESGGHTNDPPDAASTSPPAVSTTAPRSTSGHKVSGAAPRVPAPIPGYLLIADRGNNRLLLVNGAKRILWRYPRPGKRPSFPFRYDDDAFFADHFHAIITNEEDQQTIEVVGFPSGRVLWHYGHPDEPGSAPGYLNTPDDAYQLSNGLRTVADIRNCRVLWISPAHRIVRQIGTPSDCVHDPPRALGSPNGDTPLPGGGVLVTEISGSWVDAISAAGEVLWSFQAPVAYPSDAQLLPNGRVLLADYSSPGHVLILTRRGKVLWQYGLRAGPPRSTTRPSLSCSPAT